MKRALQSIGFFRHDEALLKKIHQHALDIIESCGIRFHSDEALEIWHGCGAKIDGHLVRVKGDVIEQALKKAPRSFVLCSRDGKHDLTVDGKHTYFCQDGCSALTLDPQTGARRSSRKEDVEKMALIGDYLETIDVVSPMVSAQDAPLPAIQAHELQACFVNSGKHVITVSVSEARQARSQIDLAAAVAGGKEALRRRPLFTNVICTISPLTQDPGGIGAALEFARAGIPAGLYSMATAGVTSPVTLAGTMAVLNAEVICGLALLQIAVPGCRMFYAGGPATMDLPTGNYTSSSPEALWLRLMVAEMANFYSLPSIVGSGATMSKDLGPQSAWEHALSFLLNSLAGADLLFGLGLLDGSNLLTYEGLVLDAEIGAIVRRLLSEVDLSDDAFALDLIKELGPGGVYIDTMHTVEHMRSALSIPALSNRDSYDQWSRKGALSRVEAARLKTKEILETHQPPPLPDDARRAMAEVLAAYEQTS
jgi:trimethylamine--corrinoid protein Co-methyltransferase